MIYLYVAAVAALYLSILIFVPTWAKKRNRHPLPWVLLSMAILFVGATWDFVPRTYFYTKKCMDLKNGTGDILEIKQLFPVKTVVSSTQWKEQNTELINNLNKEKIALTINTENDLPQVHGYEIINVDMSKFIAIVLYKRVDKGITTVISYVLDRHTGEALSRYIDIIREDKRELSRPFGFFLNNIKEDVCVDKKRYDRDWYNLIRGGNNG